MPTSFDLLYVALFAVGFPLYDALFGWPAYARRRQADPARARAWLWSTSMVQAWCFVGLGAGYWLYAGRPWSALKLTMPEGWRLAVAVALVAAYSVYQLYSIAQLRRDPALRDSVRPQVAAVADVVPHTRPELSTFTAVSFTAGFCEEFLYRGYFLWALAPWLGWWGAVAVSTVCFALGHAYQGWLGVLRTGIVGALYALTVWLLDSLWPAIVLHVLVDVFGGIMAWLVLRDDVQAPAPALHNGR